MFSLQEALVDAACERNVALLLVVHNVEGIRDLGGVEPALDQLELLLLEGARQLHHLLQEEEEEEG